MAFHLSKTVLGLYLVLANLGQTAAANTAPLTPPLQGKIQHQKLINDYLNIQGQFVKDLCKGGADQEYQKLFKDFQENPFYIPTLDSVTVDFESISEVVPEWQKKELWVIQLQEDLKKTDFPNLDPLLKQINARVKNLLNLKKMHHPHFPSQVQNKNALLENSKREMDLLREDFQNLTSKIPFLQGYKFPVDHLALRKKFDSFKGKDDLKSLKSQNLVLMTRKVVEDGATDIDQSNSDLPLRALLSTIHLRLQGPSPFLREHIRYDLRSLEIMLKNHLRGGKERQIQRLGEWRKRIAANLAFYNDILKERKKVAGVPVEGKDPGKSPASLEQFLEKIKGPREVLKEFTLKKQKDVFSYWMKFPEIFQALFVFETILFNEVGDIDGRAALERKDIAQVVINRKETDLFSRISLTDNLYPYLKPLGEDQIAKNKWLNILFKEGEFSFTYYYIPASVKIYCPDMTRIGMFLRRENLKLSLHTIENHNKNFQALRYFSRHSMLGRIDMSTLWDDYSPLPERPGKLAKHGRLLKSAFLNNKYQYFYSFRGKKNNWYHVLEFDLQNEQGPRPYVLWKDKRKLHFFQYRNPHFFKFFSKKG